MYCIVNYKISPDTSNITKFLNSFKSYFDKFIFSCFLVGVGYKWVNFTFLTGHVKLNFFGYINTYLDRIKKNFCDIAKTKNVGAPFSDLSETRLWFFLKNFQPTCKLIETLNLAKIWYTTPWMHIIQSRKKEIWYFDFLTFQGVPKTQTGSKTTLR